MTPWLTLCLVSRFCATRKGRPMDRQKMLDEAEGAIKHFAWKHCSKAMPYEDFAQELRIMLLKDMPRFDESKSSWKTWSWMLCKWRVIDIARRYGTVARVTGNQNKIRVTESLDRRFDDEGNRVVEPEDLEDAYEDVDWADLEERVQSSLQVTQMAFYRMQGLTMTQVGERLGVSESRVSQALSDGEGIRNLAWLIGEFDA